MAGKGSVGIYKTGTMLLNVYNVQRPNIGSATGDDRFICGILDPESGCEADGRQSQVSCDEHRTARIKLADRNAGHYAIPTVCTPFCRWPRTRLSIFHMSIFGGEYATLRLCSEETDIITRMPGDNSVDDNVAISKDSRSFCLRYEVFLAISGTGTQTRRARVTQGERALGCDITSSPTRFAEKNTDPMNKNSGPAESSICSAYLHRFQVHDEDAQQPPRRYPAANTTNAPKESSD